MQHDRLPLYMQIQDYFKERITTGQLKGNDKIPSEKELMEQFEVSRITVANALVRLAEEGWIYRIPGRGSFVKETTGFAQRNKPDFTPASAAEDHFQGRAMTLQPQNDEAEHSTQLEHAAGRISRRMIGLIIPTLEDLFAVRLIAGVNEVLKEHGYHLYVVFSNNDIETEKKLILESIASGASGLIIFPSDAETYNEEILALKMRNYPFVLIDRYLAGVETNFVCTDGLEGAKLALHHLWELGHRDIAICSDTPLPTITVSDRINGYMEALKQLGAMINPSMILTDFEVDYTQINEDHPLFRFIRNRMATAYITLNAKLGGYIFNIARQIGLKVPEDISILTFDNPSPSYDESGFYTHISQSEHEIGTDAADILINLLENRSPANKYSKIVKVPELVVRSSTSRVKA
ncbi:GntR family transcriptional regulator [Paenibacillus sp. R14(2021)]|uniref:GntR family transcriptional regulator n=1 Tax=Paenibacillus sp. R14(2021) TaxID=2859228 RepID=UPI001C6153E8|nr:GntR family transcriptional regulator [Paenibacillus sp. R14(2021)]